MYVLGYFLQAIAGILDIVLTLAMVVVIARAVLSWVSPDPYNPIVRMINQFSEPVLYPIRRRLPYIGGMDLSPMVVLLVIFFLQSFLVNTLARFSASLIH
ncbi:MAG: YggT family protein [Zetaproteobacteria bacterium]|nr:YggT family protein [Zetaproteobacteria bacterium]